MGITIINHPFGNGLYQLSMVIWGMVYYCYTHVDFAIAMEAIKLDDYAVDFGVSRIPFSSELELVSK